MNNPLSIEWFSRLVSGAGDIKLTKDGNILLHEMVSVNVNVCPVFMVLLSGNTLNIITPLWMTSQ